jgi:uncharacterized coiled-coil DUF342 family protein
MIVEGCLSCLSVLAFIFVVAYLYFAITGRCRAIEAEAKDDERYASQQDWENQIKVLTVRIGEITTENDRLNKVCHSWMETANSYKLQLDTKTKEADEYKESAKKAESKYLKTKKELDSLQQAVVK